jgi:hypothetical protein
MGCLLALMWLLAVQQVHERLSFFVHTAIAEVQPK